MSPDSPTLLPSDSGAANDWIDLLQMQARCRGEQICFSLLADGSTVSQQISFAELDLRARALAVSLSRQVEAGDRVMLLMPNGIDYIVGFFATLYAGLIAVTAYPPQHKKRDWGRISGMVQDCDARLVLCSAAQHDKVAQWLQAEAAGCPLQVVGTELLAEAQHWQKPVLADNALAYLQYSSGSTGAPKGVMLSHANLLHNVATIVQEYQMDSADRFVSWLPMYHDMGFVGGVLAPLFAGAQTWLIPPPVALQTPFLWLKAISDLAATVSGGPNFIFEHCVARISEAQKAELDLSRWRCAVNGAEPIHAQTLAQFNQAFARAGLDEKTLKPSYGMAETCLFVSAVAADEGYRTVQLDDALLGQGRVVEVAEGGVQQASSGRLNARLQVQIVGPDTGVPVAADQVGEIWIRSASVAAGYWNKPEISAQTFNQTLNGEPGYLRTGDLGFVLDNQLYVCGRRKEMLIVNGRNHYPQDIEATVQTLDADLSDHGAAVFELTEGREPAVVLVQELSRRGSRRDDLDTLITGIRQVVAQVHEISLAAVVLIAPVSLAKTTSGKIQRLRCREQYQAGELRVVAQWQQAAESVQVTTAELLPALVAGDALAIEQWVLGWIAVRLDVSVESLEPTLELVASGLDSVDALTLTHELAQGLNRELLPDLIWDYPTVHQLAAHLAQPITEAVESDAALLEGEI